MNANNKLASDVKDEILDSMREEIDSINFQLLELLNKRAEVALAVGRRKAELGVSGFDPMRESAMLQRLMARNQGPFDDSALQDLFKSIFSATLELMNRQDRHEMLVSRRSRSQNTLIEVNGVTVGAGDFTVMSGPCSVEDEEQLQETARFLASQGLKIMRGGAFKPRTSPYSFQGLGLEGLKMLHRVAREHDLAVISEILDPRDLEAALPYLDIIQIGARNMYNYPLLKAVGQSERPVMLKRHFGATLEELLMSAEYILAQGNGRVMLCERGIRTFEDWTRSTLDISAIPLLKAHSHLPVVADISHAAGRRDILIPLAKAVQGAGADALMVEVHPSPALARSDRAQQLDLPAFAELLRALELNKV